MLEFTLLVLIATFLYFGGLEGVISLLAGTFSIVLNILYYVPVIVGILTIYGIYWITYVY